MAAPPIDLATWRERSGELFGEKRPHGERAASEAVWHLVRVAGLVEHQLERQVHRPSGWSWTGFRIMITTHTLAVVEPGTLVRLLGISAPSISSALQTLEKGGYVVRSVAPDSGRKVNVRLTEKGEAAIRRVDALHHRTELELMAPLSVAEREQLSGLLARLLAAHWPD